jgi:hypothetical protein
VRPCACVSTRKYIYACASCVGRRTLSAFGTSTRLRLILCNLLNRVGTKDVTVFHKLLWNTGQQTKWNILRNNLHNDSKSKDVLLWHGGSKGERKYSSNSFLISTLNEDEWLASRPGRDLAPGNNTRYPLDRRLGWPQCRSGHRRRKNPFSLSVI